MAKKKFLFVYPNQRWQKTDIQTVWNLDPRVLCMLGANINDIVDVHVIDAQQHNLSQDEFVNKVKDIAPDYVGISVLTSEYGDTLTMAAKLVKKIKSETIVIAGGVHISTKLEKAMTPEIDYGCRGEGEVFLRELLLWLQGKGEMPQKGLIYRDKNGQVVAQPKTIVENLDEMPFPDYSLVDMNDYVNVLPRSGPSRTPELPGVMMIVSRGCPFGCSFCQVEMISGKKIRMRKAHDIVDEIEFLKKEYGIKSIVFQDDNLFSKKDVAKEMMREMIRRKLNLKYVIAGFAVFSLDDEMLHLLKESGCVTVNLAIESGVERVLHNIVCKPIKDLSVLPHTIQRIKDAGMYVLANFIIGLPGETWEEVRATIHYAENCNADYIKIFPAIPLKGTRLYDQAKELGVLGQHDELELNWRHSQVQSDEWQPEDISILRAYEWDRINFAPDRIQRVAELWGTTIEELNKVRKKTRETLVKELIEMKQQSSD